MTSKLEQALAEADEIEAAELTADPDAPLPAHVKVSQPGRARSKVLQVRLNPDEYEALERLAQQRDLPVSTIARQHLLQLITREAISFKLPAVDMNTFELPPAMFEAVRNSLQHATEAINDSVMRNIKDVLRDVVTSDPMLFREYKMGGRDSLTDAPSERDEARAE